MTNTLANAGIEQLKLSPARPHGYVPKPSRALQRRIASYGLLEPIAVRQLSDHHFEILNNAPSWVAAGQAGLREVPVMIHYGLSDAEAAAIVIDHYETLESDPIEEARALEDQLHATGGRKNHGAISRLARRIGVSRSQLAHSLRLLELPAEIQEAVSRGELSPGQARPLISINDRDKQRQLAKRIRLEKLSVRECERLAKTMREATALHAIDSTLESKSADVLRLEQNVTDLIGSQFEIRGTEAVFKFYGDYNVLDGILHRLGYCEE